MKQTIWKVQRFFLDLPAVNFIIKWTIALTPSEPCTTDSERRFSHSCLQPFQRSLFSRWLAAWEVYFLLTFSNIFCWPLDCVCTTVFSIIKMVLDFFYLYYFICLSYGYLNFPWNLMPTLSLLSNYTYTCSLCDNQTVIEAIKYDVDKVF